MPRNIEIKARISSVDALVAKVRSIADQGPWEVRQVDTYFACAGGRLKLRTGSEDPGELIYYRRDNQAAPKESFYQRFPTSDPKSLRELLIQALGEVGHVEKVRTVFLRGRTRIHLDRVGGLGDFLELEEVPQATDSVEMDTRSAAQEHRAHLLDMTDLTQCLDEQLPQRLRIRGREALVEGLLGRGLIVAAVIDELAGIFRAGTQFQPAAGACEIGVDLAHFPRSLVRNRPHLRHEGVDAADAGFDLDVSRHAPPNESPQSPPALFRPKYSGATLRSRSYAAGTGASASHAAPARARRVQRSALRNVRKCAFAAAHKNCP